MLSLISGSNIRRFMKLLERLDGNDNKSATMHEIQELCSSKGYVIEFVSDRTENFGAKVGIPTRRNTENVFVKWHLVPGEIKREANKVGVLKDLRSVINSPKLYDATQNFLVIEWIDGKTTSKDDVERLLLAVDHLVLIQSADVTRAVLRTHLKREWLGQQEFSDFLRNIETAIGNHREGFGDSADLWLEQIREMDQNRGVMFPDIIDPNERDFVLSHGDYKPDNLVFVPQEASLKCHPVDWVYAALRPRWYDIASFTEGCSGNAELENAYKNRYCSQLPSKISREQADKSYCQHRSLAALRVANANARLLTEGQRGEFTRSLDTLGALLEKLQFHP